MKPITALILFILTCHHSFSQVSFRTYFTKDNKETKNPEEAVFYRELIMNEGKNAPVQVIEKYTSTDKTKLIGLYNNITNKLFIGPKVQAYSNGKIKSKEKFSLDGKLIDTAEYYHPNGKLRIAYQYNYEVEKNQTKVTDTLILLFRDSIGNSHLVNGDGYVEEYMENSVSNKSPSTIEKGHYKNHKRVGEWTGFFMNEKYSFTEHYQDGKLISGVSKDSTNQEFPYDESNYMKQPSYPGDIIALRRHLANNYQYPKEAIKNKVNGTIRISFAVNKEGNMMNIKADNDLGYGTGEAAVKALRGAKKWNPGVMRGIPVNVAYTVPLRLNIQ